MARSDHLSSTEMTIKSGNFKTTVYAGTTTFDGHVPTRSSSLYQIGSITKSFTSAIILQLESEGMLNIHDPLSNG